MYYHILAGCLGISLRPRGVRTCIHHHPSRVPQHQVSPLSFYVSLSPSRQSFLASVLPCSPSILSVQSALPFFLGMSSCSVLPTRRSFLPACLPSCLPFLPFLLFMTYIPSVPFLSWPCCFLFRPFFSKPPFRVKAACVQRQTGGDPPRRRRRRYQPGRILA